MILRKIALTNIRSYHQETVEFPTGVILLSGDIGSGKSTILQSIEFALFGIKRGELSGESMLRHGCQEGSVTLDFEIEEEEYSVCRVLKRSQESIQQKAGYIVMKGMKKEATAQELRAIILDLLAYPQSLLSKSKDLIFRYTVYTPQESMKEILFASPDERLETLRKVFGIDRYKRIRENCQVMLKDIRESIRDCSVRIEQEGEKKREKGTLEIKMQQVQATMESHLPRIKELTDQKAKISLEIEKLEKDDTALHTYERELDSLTQAIMHLAKEKTMINDKISLVEPDIQKQSQEQAAKGPLTSKEELKQRILQAKSLLTLLDQELVKLKEEIAGKISLIKKSEETVAKINGMSQCPVCRQVVQESHKQSIREGESAIINEYKSKVTVLNEKANSIAADRAKKTLLFDELLKEEQELTAHLVKQEYLKQRQTELSLLKERAIGIKHEIGHSNARKIQVQDHIHTLAYVRSRIQNARRMLEEVTAKKHALDVAQAGMAKEKEGISGLILRISQELDAIEKEKQRMIHLKKWQEWLEKFFINLMGLMEKTVMGQIHHEFNETFKNWFSTLLEDEVIDCRIDDESSPVIIQNGYETSMDNLSGGEKTSVALSYRLSLNNLINTVVGRLATRDLLILDEPTDGFSSDQLDKIRDILDELTNKQIIIVSHESKIETFVQHIIRVSKVEHVSAVSA